MRRHSYLRCLHRSLRRFSGAPCRAQRAETAKESATIQAESENFVKFPCSQGNALVAFSRMACRSTTLSAEPRAMSSAEFAVLAKREYDRWGEIVATAGFAPQD
jgi:hypothetical protein